jgi:uncharacterized metal-binding protein YceD (DUF177 family)
MTQELPLAHSYNLARLGKAGDEVRFVANEQQHADIAQWAGLRSLEKLDVRVEIQKPAANRYSLAFHLIADLTQNCVVTLEPVVSHVDHSFSRELVFVGRMDRGRRGPAAEPSHTSSHASGQTPKKAPELVLDAAEEEGLEEISSLHFDLAAPVLEEFALSLEPYPRSPGVEFGAKFSPESQGSEPPESPFTVLKDLKTGA